jgi:hypothetical protein
MADRRRSDSGRLEEREAGDAGLVHSKSRVVEHDRTYARLGRVQGRNTTAVRPGYENASRYRGKVRDAIGRNDQAADPETSQCAATVRALLHRGDDGSPSVR